MESLEPGFAEFQLTIPRLCGYQQGPLASLYRLQHGAKSTLSRCHEDRCACKGLPFQPLPCLCQMQSQCPIRTVGSQPNTQEEDALSILGDGMCMGILERRRPSCDIWAPISLWAPTVPHPPILILTLTHFLNLALHFKYVKLDFSFSDSYVFGIRVSRVYYANPCK